jgi:hypothetical protein
VITCLDFIDEETEAQAGFTINSGLEQQQVAAWDRNSSLYKDTPGMKQLPLYPY